MALDKEVLKDAVFHDMRCIVIESPTAVAQFLLDMPDPIDPDVKGHIEDLQAEYRKLTRE